MIRKQTYCKRTKHFQNESLIEISSNLTLESWIDQQRNVLKLFVTATPFSAEKNKTKIKIADIIATQLNFLSQLQVYCILKFDSD
jgi:hypothetical protein